MSVMNFKPNWDIHILEKRDAYLAREGKPIENPYSIKQFIDIKFDRPIDKDNDFISPGGYEIELKDDRTIRFDFLDYEGYIDPEDPSVLHIIHSNLDVAVFPESKELLNVKRDDIKRIIECYIYTGELDETRIRPVKILSWEIENLFEIDKSIIDDYEFKED